MIRNMNIYLRLDLRQALMYSVTHMQMFETVFVNILANENFALCIKYFEQM